jgi:hypothetical protein
VYKLIRPGEKSTSKGLKLTGQAFSHFVLNILTKGFQLDPNLCVENVLIALLLLQTCIEQFISPKF